MTKAINDRPVRIYDAYPVKLAIWANQVDGPNGPRTMHTATFERTYKNADGHWRSSKALNLSDLLKVAALAQQAFADYEIVVEMPSAQ